MITLTQLSGSTAPMGFAINATDEEGNTIDPTVYPDIAVAFDRITSPPTPFDADTATWNTATWSVQPGNPNPVYWVNVTPGPGGVPVSVGSYTAYVQITTDSPYGVILPAAYAIFT